MVNRHRSWVRLDRSFSTPIIVLAEDCEKSILYLTLDTIATSLLPRSQLIPPILRPSWIWIWDTIWAAAKSACCGIGTSSTLVSFALDDGLIWSLHSD